MTSNTDCSYTQHSQVASAGLTWHGMDSGQSTTLIAVDGVERYAYSGMQYKKLGYH